MWTSANECQWQVKFNKEDIFQFWCRQKSVCLSLTNSDIKAEGRHFLNLLKIILRDFFFVQFTTNDISNTIDYF